MSTPLRSHTRDNARHCFVCGPDNPAGLHLDFYRLDDDAVYTELVPPAQWQSWDGLMHGGLQCLLLDEVTAWALTGLRRRAHFFTTGLEIKYRRPVRLDQKITLVGRIMSETHTGSRVHGAIMNGAGDILSEATARIVHLSEDRFHRIIDDAP